MKALAKWINFSIAFIIFIQAYTYAYASENPSVVFLNPGFSDDVFFKPTTDFMQHVANDLNINLEIIYSNRNRLEFTKNADKLLQRKNKPEYILLSNEQNAAANLIPKAEEFNIKIFLFNNGILEAEAKTYGAPGTIYKNWIGELLPDDEQAGYILAKYLIDEALQKKLFDAKGTLHIAGISGMNKTTASQLRVKGLYRAVSEYPNVKLHQIVSGYWETKKAQIITKGLLNRYENISVIWAASDGMALGAIEGIKIMKKTPGKDVLVGGVDWAKFTLDLIKNNELTATVGGHYLDGGLALLMIYDYHNGVPLIKKKNLTKFTLLNSKNIGRLSPFLIKDKWDNFDFKKRSKTENPTLKKYWVSFEDFIKDQ